MLTIQFLKAGMLTTVQDGGRNAYELGVPRGGVMDRKAARLANGLVGNSPNTCLLELTMIGPKVVFDAEATIAITGARMSPTLDGVEIQEDLPIKVGVGQVLSFGRLKWGLRSYLAIQGTWVLETVLKSKSTLMALGPKQNLQSWMQSGSQLQIDTNASPIKAIKGGTSKDVRIQKTTQIQVEEAPEFRLFDSTFVARYFSQDFTISNESNRMAYKLNEQLPMPSLPSMISSGVLPGTIQINAAGQPMILLVDAQTVGGYPRILKVADSHLDLFGQLKPGDRLRFVFAS